MVLSGNTISISGIIGIKRQINLTFNNMTLCTIKRYLVVVEVTVLKQT